MLLLDLRPSHHRHLAHVARGKTLAEHALSRHPVRLGQAYARLGMRRQAIAAGRRAVDLTPVSADANSGPFIAMHLAEIYVMVGEADQAVATLEPLLKVASWISPAELRVDPLWAPLRGNARFRMMAGMK